MKSISKIVGVAVLLSLLAVMIVLTVACEEIESYKVTFMSEGEVYSTYTYEAGTVPTLPPTPYKEGHEFVGWFTDDGTFKVPFTPAGITSSITLYAQWRDPNALPKYTVSFDLGDKGTLVPAVITQGMTVGSLAIPEVTGYEVIGWYTDAAYTTAWNMATDTVSADMTLYAKWALKTYHAYFMSGSTVVADIPFTMETETLENVPTVPDKTGYTGVWESYTLGTEHVTVNAVYTTIPYSITYIDSKQAENSNPATYTVEDTVSLCDLVDATNEFLFVGWSTDGTEGALITEIPTGTTGNITLTAVWEKMPPIITYIGVQSSEHENPTLYRPTDGVVTLTDASRTWYTFVGWYLEDSCTTEVTTLTPEAITDDTTLYAKWEATTYTVTYYNDNVWYAERTFDVDHQTWSAPEVPNRAGYTAAWSQVSVAPQNLRVDAVFTPIRYTIHYEGVTAGEHSNPATWTVEDGAVTLTKPSRAWYSFAGWYLESAHTTPVTTLNTSTVTDDIALYAKWDIVTYKATYYNGTEVFDEVEFDVERQNWLSPAVPEKTGYTAVWSSFTVTPNNIRVDAVFTPIRYTIHYEGLLAGDTHANPATYTIEDAITLTPASRRGYKFLGWTRGGSACTAIAAGTTGEITLTATWEIETYSITYENTKGADTSAFPADFTIETANFALPTALTTDGYTFVRWLANGSPLSEVVRGTEGNLTLTAEWRLTPYTIVYEGLLTGDTHANPAAYTIEDAITLTPASRRGYKFLGWTRGGSTCTAIAAGTTGEITLTATWEVLTYSVTYENTKGADTSAFPSVYTIESGAVALPALTPPNGYTFLGWKNAEGQLVTSIPAGSVGDMVFTASYEATSYVVTLHPMGGTLSSKTFTVGLDQPFTFPVPKKEGHNFVGWYENTGDSTQLTDENGVSVVNYPYISNRILYAHYTPVQYNIYFDTNGGDNSIPAATYAFGTTFDPSRHVVTKGEGSYFFAGWYTADELECYDETTRITSNATLYAKWMESTPIYTLDDLLAIQQNPSGTYHLANNITLRGEEFVPWASFSGILDGNGFSVYNFTLSNEANTNFAMIKENSGTIKNLTISGFTFNSTHHNIGDMVSAVLTVNNTGTIENCTITEGVIKLKRTASYDRYGSGSLIFGIYAGTNSGIIKNCVNEVGFDVVGDAYNSYGYYSANNVTLSLYIGGIVGENKASGLIELCRSTVTNTTTIKSNCGTNATCVMNLTVGGVVANNYGSCVNTYADFTSNITGTVQRGGSGTLRVGGFVGYNAGNIEGSSSVGAITGGNQSTCYMGGFVGHNNTANGVIRSSHSDIDITNGNYGGEIGGFVGNNCAKILTSYASGDISSDKSSSVGGFVGYHHDGATITQSFASGNVRKPSGEIGAFIGTTSATGTTRECFFLTNATLMINGVYVEHTVENGNIIGKTYLELLSEELLVKTLEWDGEHWVLLFDETPVLDWEIGIGHSYKTTVISPNCEDFGYTVYECTHCSRFYISDFTSAWGHTFDPKEKLVVDATCTEGGYTSEVCLVCHKEVRTAYTEATGHTSERVAEHVPPTCMEEGHNTHVCAGCGKSYTEILPAIGHDPYVSIQYQTPSCSMSTEDGLIEVPGHTDEIKCDICEEILQASVPVAPHSFKLESVTTPASCTEDGLGTWVCEYENCKHSKTDVIYAAGHLDENRDGCCDTCKIFLGFEGVEFIEIWTLEDLLRITTNASTAYRLMADIDLGDAVFNPLCSEKRPFTGYFDGNGKTIYNLNASGLAIGGLFAYNEGTIRNLTISGVAAELTADGTFGAIAAYNNGTISECTVTGVIRLSVTGALVVNDKVDQSTSITARFGGIAAVNGPSAVIYGCKVSGSVGITVTNTIDVNVKSSVLYWIRRNYKTYFTSSVSVTFGGIAGVNEGLVECCQISTTEDIGYSTIAGITRAGGIKFGYATVRIGATYGAIVGMNTGTMVGNTTDHTVASSAWVMFNSTEGNTWADNYDIDVKIAE